MAYPETAETTTKLNLRKPGTTDTPNVTTDIGNNMQKIDDFATEIDSGKAAAIQIESTDTSWPQIFNKIKVIPYAKPTTIYINANAIAEFTAQEITSGAWMGLICRTSTTTDYSLLLKSYGNQLRACAISNATSTTHTFTSLRKADNDDVVHNTGTETIGGTKTFSGSHVIKNATQSPLISFQGTNNAQSGGLLYCRNCGNSSGNEYYGSPIFSFIEYSPSLDGATRQSAYERYDLPAVDVDRSGSKTYKIITQKNITDFFTVLSCANGTNNFTIAKGSRIRIDLLTTNAARMGTILVTGNSSSTAVYFKADVGANVTVTSSAGTLTITTNAAIDMYCTVYAGSITAA